MARARRLSTGSYLVLLYLLRQRQVSTIVLLEESFPSHQDYLQFIELSPHRQMGSYHRYRPSRLQPTSHHNVHDHPRMVKILIRSRPSARDPQLLLYLLHQPLTQGPQLYSMAHRQVVIIMFCKNCSSLSCLLSMRPQQTES